MPTLRRTVAALIPALALAGMVSACQDAADPTATSIGPSFDLGGGGPAVFINEIHYDNSGTDAGEFIEIAGPAGTILAGYVIELYNGSNGVLYDTDPLVGTIPDQQNGFGTVALSYPSNGIQNGSPDGIALVNGTTVIQFLSYEGAFTATIGTAAGMTSTDIGVSESGSEPLGLSLQLQGTGATYGDFTWAGPIVATPGAVNTGQTFTAEQPCFVPSTDYPTIQDAVNDPTCNPINVAAGAYPELDPGPLTINRTVMLLGPQNGVDARGRLAAEAHVTDLQGTFITANNVVIDGFTIENSTNQSFTGYGILIGAATTGTQILNNIIQDNIVGIGLGGSQVLIRHNQIQNNNQPGGASGTGIYTDQFVSGGAVNNVLVQENAFIGNVDAGIDVSNTALPGVSNLEVATNSFNLNGRGVVLFNTHMSSIHDNSITNSTFVGSAAIRLFDNNSNLNIMNNNLATGAGHAIRLSVLGLVGGANSGVVINENNIGTVGSTSFVLDGLLVDPGSHDGTVDAQCNWWGSSTGPMNVNNTGGTGEEVVGDADFTPWLLAPDGVCAGGVPSGKVTGGGQIDVNMPSGRGTFGFNAKSEDGVGSGHLNYLNHATGAHLDCEVEFVTELTATTAKFQGTCTPKGTATAMSFMAEVEDHGSPKNKMDRFKIMYGTKTDGDGETIRSGNIEIRQ